MFEIPENLVDAKVVLFEGPNGSGKTTLLEAIACAVDGPGIGFGPKHSAPTYLGDGMRRTFSWVVDFLVRLQRINWADMTFEPECLVPE